MAAVGASRFVCNRTEPISRSLTPPEADAENDQRGQQLRQRHGQPNALRTAEPRHEEEARNEKDEPAQECETRSDPDPFEALVVSDRRQIDDKADEAQGEPR